MTTQELIAIVKPEKVYTISSNFMTCDINGQFCEFQIDYKNNKKWYQFESYGKAKAPKEKFIKYIN